jgi:hypothetical protein
LQDSPKHQLFLRKGDEMLDRDFPKVRAIKEVRESTGAGLKEAKDAVDSVVARCSSYDQVVQEACHIVNPATHGRYVADEEPQMDYKAMFEEVQNQFSYHADSYVRDTLDNIVTKERNRVMAASAPFQLKEEFNRCLDDFWQENSDVINKIDDCHLVKDILMDCVEKKSHQSR